MSKEAEPEKAAEPLSLRFHVQLWSYCFNFKRK